MSAEDGSPPPRLALRRAEAASALGMSLDSFERYVQPFVRLLRLGKLRLVPVVELERFLAEQADEPMIDSLATLSQEQDGRPAHERPRPGIRR